MLSKSVCGRCRIRVGMRWGEADEMAWTTRVVYCSHFLQPTPFRHIESFPGGTAVLIDKEPPEWCPYGFEHAVAEGMADAK